MTIDALSIVADAAVAAKKSEMTSTAAKERNIRAWQPVDIAGLLAAGLEDLETTVLARTDGFKLFYPGKVHSVFGESGSMKTWMALLAAVQEIQADHRVMYIDYEDSPNAVLRRLKLFGLTDEQLIGYFEYRHPNARIDDDVRASLKKTIEDSTEHPFTLVIIDAVTEIMAAHGWKTNHSEDVATFYADIGKWFADLGPAVVTIDHVSKAKEEGGNSQTGSQHKKAGIDGASYRIEPKEWGGKGRHGKSHIVNCKDRNGAVDADTPRNKVVGILNVKSNPITFAVEAWIDKPDAAVVTLAPATSVPTNSVSESVLRSMHRFAKKLQQTTLPNGFSKTELVNMADDVKTARAKKLAAVDILKAKGCLVESGNGSKLKVGVDYKSESDIWAEENGLG
ncbi:AAA family ATPase [Micromonospora carbonacea]|uniref:AAA domain-containing protein n=1 Tax=Micromonospora carbonacea TaxID=47853 RepID=A0A1C5AMC6_9ACTN|nr:AAA family ATPase [Micromonospora carbonacea]SCF46385.1 AAA domain-containing protein [Micromonospora carbonacea]